MIIVQLSDSNKKELEEYRKQASSNNSEKSLMILMSNEKKSPVKIGATLKRNPHTVRLWLKRYIKSGIKGLQRRYSLGRPRTKRDKIAPVVQKLMKSSPLDYGYQDRVWTIPLIVHYLKEKHDLNVSEDTVTRYLNESGYSFKRPAKTVSAKSPSKEEKRVAVSKIISEIQDLQQTEEFEVLALDESHFSNEPYLVRGWQKKRWPPSDSKFTEAGASHILWLLEFPHMQVLLEIIRQR